MPEGVPAAWGDLATRGVLWETITATTVLESGADIVVLRHPRSMSRVQKTIADLMTPPGEAVAAASSSALRPPRRPERRVTSMALTGLEIYKLLPKTNCKECGFPTCLAFAMKLAPEGRPSSTSAPTSPTSAKAALDAASAPPIRLVTVGTGERRFAVGNETVLFRHEKTFFHQPGLGVRLTDNDPELAEHAAAVRRLRRRARGHEAAPQRHRRRERLRRRRHLRPGVRRSRPPPPTCRSS